MRKIPSPHINHSLDFPRVPFICLTIYVGFKLNIREILNVWYASIYYVQFMFL